MNLAVDTKKGSAYFWRCGGVRFLSVQWKSTSKGSYDSGTICTIPEADTPPTIIGVAAYGNDGSYNANRYIEIHSDTGICKWQNSGGTQDMVGARGLLSW